MEIESKNHVHISRWYRTVQPVLFAFLAATVGLSAYILYAVWPRLQLLYFSLTTEAEAGCGCSALFSFTDQPLVNGLTLAAAGIAAFVLLGWLVLLMVNALRTAFVLRSQQIVDGEPLHVDGKRYRMLTVESGKQHVFTAGFFRPAVIIDSSIKDAMSQEELQSVLWHEVGHIRSRDPLKKWLLFSFIDMWRWIPGMRDLRVAVETAQELLADEYALKRTKRSSLLRAFTALAGTRQWENGLVAAFHIGDARLQGLLLQQVKFPFVQSIATLFLVLFGVMGASAAVAHGDAAGALPQPVVNACIHQIAEYKKAGMSIGTGDTSVQCEAVVQSVEAAMQSEMPAMSVQ